MLDNFGIKDIVDILLVAVVMYQLYRLVKKSGTTAIFNGIVAFLVLWVLIFQVFQMRLLGVIMDQVVKIGLIIIVILFQDEIKRFLISLGSNRTFKYIAQLFGVKKNIPSLQEDGITAIVLACINMSKSKTGALIVVEQEMALDMYEKAGEIINADVSTRMIESIFFKNSPLHDGAMVISKNKIKAAGCILPVSQRSDLPKHLGLRHRAALGITSETDALAIVVSEERGKISYAVGDALYQNVSAENLQSILLEVLRKKNKSKKKNKQVTVEDVIK